MNKILISAAISAALLIGCMGKAEAPGDNLQTADFEADRGVMTKQSGPKKEGKKDVAGMKSAFFPKVKHRYKRLVEYTVSLSYKIDNLDVAREQLMAIIRENGFLSNSSASGTDSQNMSTQINIDVNKLYDALQKFDKLGLLQYESISSTDHTENSVWQQRKVRRENLRIVRRNKAMSGSAARKNWQERENALAASENEIDQAAHEKWKISDRVSWAKIHLSLNGPVAPAAVKVPNYVEALVGLVNMALALLYLLIYAAPFITLIVLAWVMRERIKRVFARAAQ